MNVPLANYDEPCRSIEALFAAECSERILLLRGESGSGKSTLVDYCLDLTPADEPLVHFDFKNSTFSVPEVLSLASEQLGRERLPGFTHHFGEWAAMPIEVRENRQQGFGNQINVDARYYGFGDREQQRARLTEAWFEDVAGMPERVLIVFDTFEQASSDVRDWIGGSFLIRAARHAHVRVLVAGQKVPEPTHHRVRRCSRQHDLYGVEDARDWLPVVKALGLRLEGLDPLSVLVGICGNAKGNPAEIMRTLQDFKRRESQ